ncbi:MAG: ATP-binding cassette domain-containing protein, partial [Anaerolineales bacterium]|nr:ATP-binding cassette domain-containing protein [Anaerolineales bacterium]
MKADGRPMLKLSHVDTHYGPIQILRDVNVEINAGEITCLLGGNASGKSTTLRTVIGMVRPSNGTIEFNGEQIDGLNTQQLVERGISMVPENRRIFGRMTVQE